MFYIIYKNKDEEENELQWSFGDDAGKLPSGRKVLAVQANGKGLDLIRMEYPALTAAHAKIQTFFGDEAKRVYYSVIVEASANEMRYRSLLNAFLEK